MTGLLRCLVLVFAASAVFAAPPPKNVILLVGDGMGPAHVTRLRQLRGAETRMARLPVGGIVTTECADFAVTDSAAAGTAIATGVKAKRRSLGMDANGVAQKSVLDAAHAAGKSAGLVTTAKFFDATPAAFTSAAIDRYHYAKVIPQMLESRAEVIAGSGAKWFEETSFVPLTKAAADAGYRLITNPADLDAATGPRLLAVFPEQTHDVDNPAAPLPVLARWAIDRLSKDPDGFFLLIEHEGIDSTSHQNDTPGLERSLVSFDTAIGVALDFAAKNPNTLVVVTADHETGGLLLDETQDGQPLMKWANKTHSAVAVPIFAQGPGAESFSGFLDNTDVGKRLIALVSK